MRSRSTKTRTAALNPKTRGFPGPWYGRRRCVRSTSASILPMVVPCSSAISRNWSQKLGSSQTEVGRPAGAERVGICRTALCVRGDLERAGNANGCRDSGDSVRPDLFRASE